MVLKNFEREKVAAQKFGFSKQAKVGFLILYENFEYFKLQGWSALNNWRHLLGRLDLLAIVCHDLIPNDPKERDWNGRHLGAVQCPC